MAFQMADQFKGLPMGDLIGGPLQAACDAQVRLANATADFIKVVGFMPPDNNGNCAIRNVSFAFDRALPADTTGRIDSERVHLDIPLLAIVKVPSLAIESVDIVFDMEVKSSESSHESQDTSGSFSADASVGWGPFSMKVHVQGAVSSHKDNTRSTDQSAKYHVEVHAKDTGMPEGLARVMDIIQTSVAPKAIEKPGTPKTDVTISQLKGTGLGTATPAVTPPATQTTTTN